MRSKNILFYLPELNDSWGGVRQYSIALLNILANQSEYSVFIYNEKLQIEMLSSFTDKQGFHFINAQHINRRLDYLWKLLQLKIRNRCMRLFPKEMRRLESPEKIILNALCKKYQIDIIHTPYQYLPTCTYAKRITTMHDVQEIYFPEYFDAEARAYRATTYLKALRNADAVIVSFDHIKKDLVKYFQVPEKDIAVIPPDFTQLWIKDFLDKKPASRASLSLPGKYIFYPANYWPHKNHDRLIDAIHLLRQKHPDIRLILSGHGTDTAVALKSKLLALGLQEEVKTVGLVDAATLYAIYKHAHSVVVPTLYEAGSFPVIEAMQLGIPVICAATTSLPDTLDNNNLIFDGFSVASIAERMEQIWSDEVFTKNAIDHIGTTSVKFKTSSTLSDLLSLYNGLIQKNQQ